MRKVAFFMVVLFLSASAAVFALDPSTPQIIVIDKIQEKKPPVTFQHWKHQDRVNNECKVCHHKREGENRPRGCSECHGKKEDAPDFKKAVHTTCRNCHKKKKAEGFDPPTKCSGCHPKG